MSAVPAMLRDLINQLLDNAPDIEVVEPPPARGDRSNGSASSPDVILLITDSESDEDCWRSLVDCPMSSVLAVDRRCRNASLYQLRRYKESLGEPSAEGLITAIRQAARRRIS
jgi:hypothetical protein